MRTVNKEEFRVSVTFEFSKERIGDLLCCAFEGGINYWGARIDLDKSKKPNQKVEYDYWEWPTNGGSIHIVAEDDYPDEENPLCGDINTETIKKGLALMAEKSPKHMADFINENEDANTGDVFVQYILFGELVFG